MWEASERYIPTMSYAGPLQGPQRALANDLDPDDLDPDARTESALESVAWWYEGGGLYRHVSLVRASPVHVAQDGLFAYSNISFAADGSAKSAVVHLSAEVLSGLSTPTKRCVSFVLTAPDGTTHSPSPAVELSHRYSCREFCEWD